MNLIALAIARGIATCVFIFYKDIYNREPKLNLIVSFFPDCLAIVSVSFIATLVLSRKLIKQQKALLYKMFKPENTNTSA